MTVALLRNYGAYPAGAIVTLPASTEAALITQNLANASSANPTAGAQSSIEFAGRAAFAAGASSVVVTNPNVTPQSKVDANINQATADGTLTAIQRIVPANGSFTVYGNANATAVLPFDWWVTSTGLTPNQ